MNIGFSRHMRTVCAMCSLIRVFFISLYGIQPKFRTEMLEQTGIHCLPLKSVSFACLFVLKFYSGVMSSAVSLPNHTLTGQA